MAPFGTVGMCVLFSFSFTVLGEMCHNFGDLPKPIFEFMLHGSVFKQLSPGG